MLMTSTAKNGTTQSVNETFYDIKQLKTHRWALMYLKCRASPVPTSNSQRCPPQSTGHREVSHTAACFVRHGVSIAYTVTALYPVCRTYCDVPPAFAVHRRRTPDKHVSPPPPHKLQCPGLLKSIAHRAFTKHYCP
uniref:Uncharacterized protein n=1 Tax=Rhipicephalus zambeziensis TaxID=60191 RepID=A0A224YAB7_9ACAR